LKTRVSNLPWLSPVLKQPGPTWDFVHGSSSGEPESHSQDLADDRDGAKPEYCVGIRLLV